MGIRPANVAVYTSYQGRHTWPEAVLGAAHTPPPPFSHTHCQICVISVSSALKRGWPPFRGLKVL
jgi:hypothetical protein